MKWIYSLVEGSQIPDPLIRLGIRRLLRQRLHQIAREDTQALIQEMRTSPIALHTADANEQHYELPAEFFSTVLGPRLKYSSGAWPEGVNTLAASEDTALGLTCERAGLADGMEILELGCGWGSLSLWMAEHFPGSHILAVSNSAAQRRFIEDAASAREITNLDVVTADMNDFDPSHYSETRRRFDRVVSVEMFEHMRNYHLLLARIAGWLAPEGRLFVHIFCHRDQPYFFEDRGSGDWMARHFFTGGLMPSEDIFSHFDDDLVLEQQWRLDGRHYERTLRAWLAKQDQQREECLHLFKATYGEADAERWFHRWRLFFLSCAELFGYRHGQEWFVTHSLLRAR